jgi:hypothetical protein
VTPTNPIRDHYLPPDGEAFRRAEPATGRIIVIAPTRAACETIELAMHLEVATVLERQHGEEIRIRPIAEETVELPLKVGVVNREREATPDTPGWNVVIVTTGIARRWFQSDLILPHDTLVVDEIHQTSAELELCLALGKRVGCRFIWLSATVDPAFYADYLGSTVVVETSAFDPALAARVTTHYQETLRFLNDEFIRRVKREERGVAVFLPTRAEVEEVATQIGDQWEGLHTAFYHGGQPIRVIRPFLEGEAEKPFLLAMTAAGQSALNVQGLDTVVIHDAQYMNVIMRGRNVLTRRYLGENEVLQMAGRVHGRVPGGEVYILTDRDLEFATLRPTPPHFQLAGDSERVALTAAALGVDLTELDLPVPLDRGAYRAALQRLTDRGIVADGRLTQYGRDVEAMPVDRAWGELLVQADADLIPFLAVASNIDSLHRMTRDESDLRGLMVRESDHLTAYNVYAEAVNEHGHFGKVFGLPRHLFYESLEEWAEDRGVLVKAVEDIALGAASVYRTLELPLPRRLPYANGKVLKRFRALVAESMPFDLVIDEQTADGERAKVSRGSMCGPWGAVAGTLRYFAGRNGAPRAAIEGTSLSLALIKRFARRSAPSVEYRTTRRYDGLFVVRRTEYFGFELDRDREPLAGAFPTKLADGARAALTAALVAGQTNHADQGRVRRALDHLGEYWRRSAGTLKEADPDTTHAHLAARLAGVKSLDEFHETRLRLDVADLIPGDAREALDALPKSAMVFGDRVPLDYEIENQEGIVRMRLREGQARRLRRRDLPEVDRPLHFTVVRGKQAAVRAASLDELQQVLASLPRGKDRQKLHRKHRRGRRR